MHVEDTHEYVYANTNNIIRFSHLHKNCSCFNKKEERKQKNTNLYIIETFHIFWACSNSVHSKILEKLASKLTLYHCFSEMYQRTYFASMTSNNYIHI